MRGGTLRFQAQYLRRIRVPDPTSMSPDVCSRLRQAFRVRDRGAATDAAMDAYHLARVSVPASA
jgi:adenine-specific DNA-methyltransferase